MLETLSLDGKVVVVTGGGTGLGREMGRHLARAGADMVVAGRRTGPIEEAAEEFRSMGRRAFASLDGRHGFNAGERTIRASAVGARARRRAGQQCGRRRWWQTPVGDHPTRTGA